MDPAIVVLGHKDGHSGMKSVSDVGHILDNVLKAELPYRSDTEYRKEREESRWL